MDARPARPHVVVVGASAGGVEALQRLVCALPALPNAAVFVVLHIPPHAGSRLDSVLASMTGAPVHAARDGAAVQPGTICVAVPDRHLVIEDGRMRLTRGPKECRNRPAIDVLFRSAALAYGTQAIGVVLSGMLDDGTAGLWAVKDQGGAALVQEPDEALFASMPQSALQHVQVDLCAPVDALAAEIVRRCGDAAAGAAPARPRGRDRHRLETLIANEGNALQHGVMALGEQSQYTCPDCHGVLVQIEEGSIMRFRCHTGHAFSSRSLLAEVNDAIDEGLWRTARAVEERILLLRQLAALAERRGHDGEAQQHRLLADDAAGRIQALRSLVLDAQLLGQGLEG